MGLSSSVHAHLCGGDADGIILPQRLRSMTGDWKSYLQEVQLGSSDSFEQHERTGRPLGAESFIKKAERLLNRELKKKKPQPKTVESDDLFTRITYRVPRTTQNKSVNLVPEG